MTNLEAYCKNLSPEPIIAGEDLDSGDWVTIAKNGKLYKAIPSRAKYSFCIDHDIIAERKKKKLVNNLIIKDKSVQENGGMLSVLQSRRDPTLTLTLRNQFAADMASRFIAIRGIIRKAIVEEDVLGLVNPVEIVTEAPLLAAVSPPLSTPGPEAFAFERSGEKVASFMNWLKRQEQRGILQISEFSQVGTGIEGAWTNQYIRGAYQQGIKRARQEMKKAGMSVPTIEQSGGIGSVFNQPFHVDRVGLLFTRTFEDLKGTTDVMNQQISRVLSEGMALGENPNVIARKLTRTISGPFIPAQRRAKILARTEIIRAHHAATIQEYRNFAVAGVQVVAEFRTAGDDRVCALCEGLEGERFTLDQAESIIPVHAQCRCIFIPIPVN
jgi:SPP1 gp7 family putative phage head morphogenesis protein